MRQTVTVYQTHLSSTSSHTVKDGLSAMRMAISRYTTLAGGRIGHKFLVMISHMVGSTAYLSVAEGEYSTLMLGMRLQLRLSPWQCRRWYYLPSQSKGRRVARPADSRTCRRRQDFVRALPAYTPRIYPDVPISCCTHSPLGHYWTICSLGDVY